MPITAIIVKVVYLVIAWVLEYIARGLNWSARGVQFVSILISIMALRIER